MSFAWTDQSIATLEKLWAAGETCSRIAARMGGGLTRNAIIGKVRRLDLPGRMDNQEQRAGGRFTARKSKRKADFTFGAAPSSSRRRTRAPGDQPPSPSPQGLDPSQPRDITPLASDPPLHERVALLDLRYGQCKWPIGYPAMFCGRPTCARGSGSYCTEHAARAFAGTGRKPWAPDDSRRAAFAARARQTFNVREDA